MLNNKLNQYTWIHSFYAVQSTFYACGTKVDMLVDNVEMIVFGIILNDLCFKTKEVGTSVIRHLLESLVNNEHVVFFSIHFKICNKIENSFNYFSYTKFDISKNNHELIIYWGCLVFE